MVILPKNFIQVIPVFYNPKKNMIFVYEGWKIGALHIFDSELGKVGFMVEEVEKQLIDIGDL